MQAESKKSMNQLKEMIRKDDERISALSDLIISFGHDVQKSLLKGKSSVDFGTLIFV